MQLLQLRHVENQGRSGVTVTAARPRATALPLAPAGSGAADGMPPFALVASHFAAGLGWFLLGAMGLVAIAPALASGGVLNPRTIAVAHAFTLGVIVTLAFCIAQTVLMETSGRRGRSWATSARACSKSTRRLSVFISTPASSINLSSWELV